MPEKPFTITLEEKSNKADFDAVEAGLRGFNDQYVEPDNFQPLNLFVKDENDAVIGGLLGGTYWRWLYVSTLWVAESLRGQGVGTQLLKQAEAEAYRRGCRNVHLDTFSFQAPDYYLKLGFKPWGIIEEFLPGFQRIYYRKAIEKPGGAG